MVPGQELLESLAWLSAVQGVCYHIVLPGDVTDITCEFGHVTEVATLAGLPRLCRLGEGEGERLVVCVEDETSPLQHEAEVVDPQHAGQ